MDKKINTMETEDKYLAPFGVKIPIAVKKGKGVIVWDEDGKKYIDFTSGWGVTALGHASPVITKALIRQSKLVIQSPEAWLTYSPARANLLELLHKVLPENLKYIYFSSSGCEANDAALKLARKASGKIKVIAALNGFHGRTIGTMSATGQEDLRGRFKPLIEDFTFVPFNDIKAMEKAVDNNTAAVILEPIQGEGGIIVPAEGYLKKTAELCKKHNAYFIADEIQTGFFRTGKAFYLDYEGVRPDILTMAKGIAGGFPFAAFALTEELMKKLTKGDHGGTYCGNALGCAVSYAVIKYMLDKNIEKNVNTVGEKTFMILKELQGEFPGLIKEVRGKGLLLALELNSADTADRVKTFCRNNGLIVNIKHGNIVRVFPALNITMKEMEKGLSILKKALINIGH